MRASKRSAERTQYYRVDPAGGYERSRWPSREFVELLRMSDSDAAEMEGQLDVAAGIISTVCDLAKFDVAMDRNQIVSQASQGDDVYPCRSHSGQVLPYGPGWFVQEQDGVKLVWHYGYAPYSYSSLILKVPDLDVTLMEIDFRTPPHASHAYAMWNHLIRRLRNEREHGKQCGN